MGHYWSEVQSPDEELEMEKERKRYARIKGALGKWIIEELDLGVKDEKFLLEKLMRALHL